MLGQHPGNHECLFVPYPETVGPSATGEGGLGWGAGRQRGSFTVGLPADLQLQIDALDLKGPERTGRLVDLILAEAVRCSASDVHFEPTHQTLEVRFRLDGVLHRVATLNRELAANVVSRLKVLAELLTYRQDVPQEGRLVRGREQYGVDMRVSTFPTVHGEKAAVRLFEAGARVLDLDQLGLPGPLLKELCGLLLQRTGAIFLI